MEKKREPKADGFAKAMLAFAAANRSGISLVLGGLAASGVMAGLGRFFDAVARVASFRLQIPMWLAVSVLPALAYIVWVAVFRAMGALMKPSYLKFTSMKYGKWKLEWDYLYDRKSKKYDFVRIRPVRSDCGCEMTEFRMENYPTHLICPICRNAMLPAFGERDAATKIIEHKIRLWSGRRASLRPIPVKVYNTLETPVSLSAGGLPGA